jgi:uncharacterized protein
VIKTLVDTGPIIAYCNRADKHHAWSKDVFGQVAPPLWTCEAVLAEVFYRVQKENGNLAMIWGWLRGGILRVDFQMADHWEDLESLMDRYADQEMDLADACLVKLSELHHDSRICTCDKDFLVYRRKQRLRIPLIFPDQSL